MPSRVSMIFLGTFILHRLIIRRKIWYVGMGITPAIMGTFMPSIEGYLTFVLISCDFQLTYFSTWLDPRFKSWNIVKQLRDNKICAGIDFGFEMLKIHWFVCGVYMSLRISSNADAKVIAILFTYIFYKIRCIAESAVACCPILLTPRRIASKC